ncbi:hypothetical protein COU79_03595 [Candidatus Peregrinibacteria bacterium CG10_big_fil_rev_8_21_14_0_10_54_7]|nr:MAG: hypothetical protein COU79_03595 [Candidatus Peregrinibacteria bacterium CG10_big_fil_rev_8_21_14_0_10_54_7]
MHKRDWLEGSCVIVTGSTHGIGRTLAEQCAERGAHTVVNGRTRETVRTTVDALRGRQQSVLGVVADVTDPLQVEQLVRYSAEKYGRIDALLNIVGSSGVRGSLLECSSEGIRALIEQNIFSLMNVTREALPHLRRSHGRVVNMGSLASLIAPPNYGGYAVAKYGVKAATEQLRMEHPDMSFTLACPGPIRDDAKERVAGGTDCEGLDPQQLAADILDAAGRRKRMIVRPRSARALALLLQVWPSLGERILRRFSQVPTARGEEDTVAF